MNLYDFQDFEDNKKKLADNYSKILASQVRVRELNHKLRNEINTLHKEEIEVELGNEEREYQNLERIHDKLNNKELRLKLKYKEYFISITPCMYFPNCKNPNCPFLHV
jgi:hypothetical protein